MPILSVNELWSGRKGSLDDKRILKFTSVYRVEVDDVKLGASYVLDNAPGLPALYDAYTDYYGNTEDNAVCMSRTGVQDTDMPFWWTCTFEYSSATEDSQYNDQNPLLRPPVIKWSTVIYQVVAASDVNEDAIINSARERYDPPPEKDDNRIQLVYTRNEATFDKILAAQYINKINTDAFAGFAPLEGKIRSIDADSEFDNNVQYWKVTYTIEFRKTPADGSAWGLRLLDAGFHHLTGAGNLTVNVDSVRGQPLANAALLDGSGQMLPPGEDPVFNNFDIYEGAAFANLNLF